MFLQRKTLTGPLKTNKQAESCDELPDHLRTGTNLANVSWTKLLDAKLVGIVAALETPPSCLCQLPLITCYFRCGGRVVSPRRHAFLPFSCSQYPVRMDTISHWLPFWQSLVTVTTVTFAHLPCGLVIEFTKGIWLLSKRPH